MAVDPTPQKIVEEEDKVQMQHDIQADSNIQSDIQNRNYLRLEYQNDIRLWRNTTEHIQDFWCKRNSVEYQHFDNDFSASCRQYDDCKRKFSLSMMFRKHVRGGVIKRERLMYSPSTENVYWFSCVLFSETSACQIQILEGFSDWKNAAQRIKMHEDSSTHQECVQILICRIRNHNQIASSLECQFNKEQEYIGSKFCRE
ncbi:zinc finger MYM-type protein 1 [Trichonephila clavipes]|nr:zinc finger MYM-type protein 1 [Trichonephila clavipes]